MAVILGTPMSSRGLSMLLNMAAACVLLAAVGNTQAEEASQPPVDFITDVQPILSDKCYYCHGPDDTHREAGLRLDVPPIEQEDFDYVLVPGNREESYMWERMTDPDDPMPPVDSHKTLSKEELDILGRWIDQGGRYEEHWAYAALKRPEPPQADPAWSRGEVDRFLLTKMRSKGLEPSETASPARLLRRLHLDLVGLPPTAEQVAAFERDHSEGAYRQAVEDLMASPRFGEHWAAWWLDLVRYGDSVGFHGDQPMNVWPYRDWVIRAFNENMPFDKFTRLQLAGDMMGKEGESTPDRQERLIASAYNRLSPSTAEGGAQPGEYRAIYAADRVANFGEVWLASSTGCARCHDHKYDPYTDEDFYSLTAVFEDIDHPIIYNQNTNSHWAPFEFLPENEEQAAQVAEVDEPYFAFLEKEPKALAFETWIHSRERGPKPPTGPWEKEFTKLFEARDELIKTVPYGLVTRTMAEPRPTRFLARGNWQDETGDFMKPRPPEFLGGWDEAAADGEAFNRLDLANWLFQPSNPLTARVVVNRLWSRFFGQGISRNTLDFGNQGQPPTHRELLDWLAVELRDGGWDLRHVMREIVTSNAYRQSSSQRSDLVKADPENKWLARQSAPRMPAEVLRDQALAASGLLVNKLGGPGVYPYQPKRHWASLNFPRRGYPKSSGGDLYRRSVYTWMQRTFPHPAMTVFDAPNRESCTAQRPESSTPLQALLLLNEPLNVEMARNLAEDTLLDSPDAEADKRVAQMFRHLLYRDPTKAELSRLVTLLDAHHKHYAAHPGGAEKLCRIGESPRDEAVSPIELAAYTSVGRVLLNLHETVTKP